MTGWRARLGLIVPSSNTAAEIEFGECAPEGVSIHTSRMPLESVTAEALDAMSDRALESAELFAHADVDAIAYASPVRTAGVSRQSSPWRTISGWRW